MSRVLQLFRGGGRRKPECLAPLSLVLGPLDSRGRADQGVGVSASVSASGNVESCELLTVWAWCVGTLAEAFLVLSPRVSSGRGCPRASVLQAPGTQLKLITSTTRAVLTHGYCSLRTSYKGCVMLSAYKCFKILEIAQRYLSLRDVK